MVTSERQICKDCGREFGTDEAEKCIICLSYICPYCGQCQCRRAKFIFANPKLQRGN